MSSSAIATQLKPCPIYINGKPQNSRGKVLIQTAFPTHYAIQHALRHDYEGFYKSEIEFRKMFHYPPITSMIAILFRGEKLSDVDTAALDCGRRLEAALEPLTGTRIQGPAPAPPRQRRLGSPSTLRRML